MPKATIWIREEDWEAWTKLKERPAFIHKMLELAKLKQSKEEPIYTEVEPTA